MVSLEFFIDIILPDICGQDGTAVIKNRPETYQCRIYSGKLLMMGRKDSRNM
jgi:hypothetical protein